MVSHEYKCIFIHIPKTGGTSIEKALGHFDNLERGVQDHRMLNELEPLDRITEVKYYVNRYLLGKHVNYRPELNRKEYKKYYKFTFVRNPWARVYSWYRNTISDKSHSQRLGIPVDCDFDYFVENFLDQWMLQPQLSWIMDRRGRLTIDFVGRFESLQYDFLQLLDVLDVSDVELPHLLNRGNVDFTAVYSDGSRKAVAKKYSEEIEFFNYKFELLTK